MIYCGIQNLNFLIQRLFKMVITVAQKNSILFLLFSQKFANKNHKLIPPISFFLIQFQKAYFKKALSCKNPVHLGLYFFIQCAKGF